VCYESRVLFSPFKGFLGDFVEIEHNEGENDFTNIILWNFVKSFSRSLFSVLILIDHQ